MDKKKSPLSYDRFMLAIAFLAVFIIFTRTPRGFDIWWHLRSGEEMVLRGQILLEDIFSYTRAGAQWVNVFWLADIIFFLVFKLGGFLAHSAFVALLGVVTLGVVNKQIDLPAFPRILLLVLAALAASPAWMPRPQIFSFLLLAFLDLWLYKVKLGKKRNFWLLIPLFVLWANLHGGYIWGILLLIAMMVGELFNHWLGDETQKENTLTLPELKNLLAFTGLAYLAVLINPSGIAVLRLPFHTVDVSLFISEWLSPDFHELSFNPVLWMLFLFILALANNSRRLEYGSLFKVLGFAYLTFFSRRNVAPFAIILLPVLSREISYFLDNVVNPRALRFHSKSNLFQSKALPEKSTYLINGIFILFVGLIAVIRLYDLTRPVKVDAEYPTEAVSWIRENQPDARIFNSYGWGGYLIWALPEMPVFIDGRADLYGKDIIYQWNDVVNGGPDAQDILDKWDVNLIFLEPYWSVVGELEHYGWKLSYQDENSVIYTR